MRDLETGVGQFNGRPAQAIGLPLYGAPSVADYGSLSELTAGCVGGVPKDGLTGSLQQEFPSRSGLFCL